MLRIRNAMVFIAIALLTLLFFNACEDRKGEINPNTAPTIEITSYVGEDSLGAVSDSVLFQQRIYWEAHDDDGVVEGYAFRVITLDEDGNPLYGTAANPIGNVTPGYEVLDDQGWIYHYQNGADETIPLSVTEQKTIWSDQVNALINFPAKGDLIVDNQGNPVLDSYGNPTYEPVVSIFEVKCIDDQGDESASVHKYFRAQSYTPRASVQSTKGDINGEQIGTGVVLQFTIIDNDPYVEAEADHFEFRLEKRDVNTGALLGPDDGGYNLGEDEWISTAGQFNVNQYMLTKLTNPTLLTNTLMNNVPQDSTFLIVKAVDLAGVVSEPDTISFIVKDGFYPNTLIYFGVNPDGTFDGTKNDIYALGENQFVDYLEESISRIIPSVSTLEGTHYSTPMWVDKDGHFTVMNSNDLKLYLHWGYHGEYGIKTESGNVITNNPNSTKVGSVLDELTNSPYFTEIRYFDLRLDGAAYVYAPLPAEEYNITDDDGTEWLRVPVGADIATTTILNNLEPGFHRFEARAVDLQDIGDKTPSEFIFKIVDPIPAIEKSGILIIDDTNNDPGYAPEAYVDSLYQDYFFSDYAGTVDVIDRNELRTFIKDDLNLYGLHFQRPVLSPTDLQQYKTIVWHSDDPRISSDSRFAWEYDVLNLYLRSGGNIILSAGANVRPVFELCANKGFNILDRYFGLPLNGEDVVNVPSKSGLESSFLNLQLFKYAQANADAGITEDVNLLMPSVIANIMNNPVLNPNEALGPVAYFDNYEDDVEKIFTFGSIPPGDGPLDLTQAEYEALNVRPVGISKTTTNTKCFMLGFPLSYMVPEQAKAALTQIVAEIENQ